MDLENIKNKLKGVRFDSVCLDSGNRFEAIIVKEEIDKLISGLEIFFGPPAFPSKNELSQQILKIIGEFGGILPGQTLYCLSQGEYIFFAMLWPWQDGRHTTVKIFFCTGSLFLPSQKKL